MRFRGVVLGLLVVGCGVTSQDMQATIPAESTAQPATIAETATDAPSQSAPATDTPRPTQTATTDPSATPTLDPAGLPDMQIAFIRSDAGAGWGGSEELWIMDADGSNQRLIARYRPGSTLGALGAFSPDGCQYAVTDARQGVVFDMQTGERVIIDEIDPNEPVVITNFAWSVHSSTLTFYRGGGPEFTQTIPQLRQIKRLADGSWSESETIALDPSGRVMLPVLELQGGRMLTQMFGAGFGFSRVSYITDLRTGKTQQLTVGGRDQTVNVFDVMPEGRIVFGTPTGPGVPWDPNIYIGQISASGIISDIVTLAPPQEESFVYSGKFTPDGAGVLAITQHGQSGGPLEYGLFSLLDDGSTRYSSLLSPQPSIAGHSALGSQYAVVSVLSDSMMLDGEIWLVALDGSVKASLTEGFWPVGLPICEK